MLANCQAYLPYAKRVPISKQSIPAPVTGSANHRYKGDRKSFLASEALILTSCFTCSLCVAVNPAVTCDVGGWRAMGMEKKQLNSLPCSREDRNALRGGHIEE
jgi:hypothetical protein